MAVDGERVEVKRDLQHLHTQICDISWKFIDINCCEPYSEDVYLTC